jgi:hypothetical protein
MMRTLPSLLVLLACAVVAPGAAARQSALELSKSVTQDGNRTETRHLTLTTAIGPAGKDGRVELVLTVEPKPKMHVYAPEQSDYIPITLALKTDGAIQADKPRYPKAEKYFFAPLKETQLVYSKPFKIALPVTLKSQPAGPIIGTVRYQACDDMICYLPQTVPVSWSIEGRPQGRRP